MRRNFKKLLALSLILTSLFSYIPASVNVSYAQGKRVKRDIDDGAQIVEIARLSHAQVEKVLAHWDDFNTAIGLLKEVVPSAVALELMSNGYQFAFASADRGNGIIIKQLQYPNGCTFCGGSGGLMFFPR